jgi:hypothetical protein
VSLFHAVKKVKSLIEIKPSRRVVAAVQLYISVLQRFAKICLCVKLFFYKKARGERKKRGCTSFTDRTTPTHQHA